VARAHLNLLILVAAERDTLALAPGLPREAEATALVVPCPASQANTRRLLYHHPIALHLARLKEVAPRTLLARVDKRAATLNHLTRLRALALVVAAAPVCARLGGVQLRGIKLFLLVPTKGRHLTQC
jgi:hypothetical protein